MDIDFKTKISELNQHQRVWFSSTLIGMILADGNIDRAETDFLVKLLAIVHEETEVERLKKFIHFKTVPPLTKPPGIDRVVGMTIMLDLVRIAIADQNFAPTEQEMIRHIGDSLGFTHPEVDKLVAYAFELMEKGEAKSA